jgi:hypothetical protein
MLCNSVVRDFFVMARVSFLSSLPPLPDFDRSVVVTTSSGQAGNSE